MVRIPVAWRRRGRVLADDPAGWGAVVTGDPCIAYDDDTKQWRMFLFALPPGHGQAVCEGDPANARAWHFDGPLTFTNPERIAEHGAFKPFVVLDPHRPGHAARIGDRYALLFVSDPAAKIVRRAWSERLAGPWTIESQALIGRGEGGEFDAKHVDAVSGYYFPERDEILYFYMGYPETAQPQPASPFGSAQGAAVEPVGGTLRKLGPVLRPCDTPGHWAAGWVGGLQLLPAREHRWVAVVNASPTPPDPSDESLWREEPPPSLGGFAVCDEPYPVRRWRFLDEPIERIEDIPPTARAQGERVNLWRHHALPLAGGLLALFYNSGDYFAEKLFLKVSA
jgi:hypothetical protein